MVAHFKISLGLFFVVENLDDLLSEHGFFDLPVQGAKSFLLLAEITGAAFADKAERQQHNPQHDHDGDCQERAEENHHDENADDGDNRGDYLDQALLQGHVDIVNIIGETAHQFTMRLAVKVADRQVLQVSEQFVADAERGLL